MTGDHKDVEFTPAKLVRFKKAYDLAVKSGLGEFRFEGDEFVTAYAKHVIDYLTVRFKGDRPWQPLT